MKYKGQIWLVGAGVILVSLLFWLPKGVVKQDRAAPAEAASTAQASSSHTSDTVSAEAQLQISRWKERISVDSKNLVFQDSLIQVFSRNNMFDSAAVYQARLAGKQLSAPAFLSAADRFADAAGFALDAPKSEQLLDTARLYYNRALAIDTGMLDAKIKLGLTYINTQNPMQGILMIRNVADRHPDNQLAQYHLGMLAIRSGQYNKALPRFEKLIRLEPKQASYMYYLGLCQKQLGQSKQARDSFEAARKLTKDPTVLASITEQMQEMQPN